MAGQAGHPTSRDSQFNEFDQLIVYRGGKRIGVLVRDTEHHNVWFHESPVNGGGTRRRGLSFSDKTSYVSAGNLVPPFFANLLPEGKRIEALASALGVSLKDEFSILAAVGADTIGDIKLLPGSLKKAPPSQHSLSVDGLLQEEDLREILKQAANPNSPAFDQTALPGIQSKVARFLSTFTPNTPISGHNSQLFRQVIIKCDNDIYPHLVENELYFLGLARRAQLHVPQHLLLHDEHGHRALVVSRFDRLNDSDSERVHVEDGCQLLDKRPDQKYMGSFERLTYAVCDVVDDPGKAARNMLRQYAFAYAIGNGDLHAKNISIWHNPQSGEIELSPVYDLVCTAAYGDDHMALPLNGKRRNFSPKDFRAFGERFSIHGVEADAICADVAGVVEQAIVSGQLKQLGFNEKKTRSIERKLQIRVDQLQEGLERRSESLQRAVV